jgi:hypothetical protein
MSVGIQEIAITFIVACFVAVVTRRRAEGNVSVWQNRKWLWGRLRHFCDRPVPLHPLILPAI